MDYDSVNIFPVIHTEHAKQITSGIVQMQLYKTTSLSDEEKGEFSSTNFSSSGLLSGERSWNYALYLCLCVNLILGIFLLLLYIGKDIIQSCLIWLDSQEEWIVCVVFFILYTVVSFPFVWGYIILNIACGYHFGFLPGLTVNIVAAAFGMSVAHFIMKKNMVNFIASRLVAMETMWPIMAVLENTQAVKVVAVSRLSPLPFGLVNAAFAVTSIHWLVYVLASSLGLLPAQIISVYLGTTVRSMKEVLADESTAFTGYGMILVQILVSVGLMICIVRKARRELKRTVEKEFQTKTKKASETSAYIEL
ncbi:transmembrane protein 64-like [Limulus polyphemus]|uniref:Transmembrane protein 64-like n=1 Tax=Limulus polyphemus TaxID=6850 RepID=A0ABM1BWU3_LIMPO|nr:transmembrane protein 64-like [Limulus polyphemus]